MKNRGFKVIKDATATLKAEKPSDKLTNVQFNLDGTLTTVGTNPITIDNSSSDKIIQITENGKVKWRPTTPLINYSGTITAKDDGSGN